MFLLQAWRRRLHQWDETNPNEENALNTNTSDIASKISGEAISLSPPRLLRQVTDEEPCLSGTGTLGNIGSDGMGDIFGGLSGKDDKVDELDDESTCYNANDDGDDDGSDDDDDVL